MLRRRRKPDPRDLEKLAAAARDAEEACRLRAEVESSTSEIMGEVQKHRKLLARNNFADRWRAVLGGAGR